MTDADWPWPAPEDYQAVIRLLDSQLAEAEAHIAADHAGLRRAWDLAQCWRQIAADCASQDTRWLSGAAELLEQAITGAGDDPL